VAVGLNWMCVAWQKLYESIKAPYIIHIFGWQCYFILVFIYIVCAYAWRTWKLLCLYCHHPFQILSHRFSFYALKYEHIVSRQFWFFIYLDWLHVLDQAMLEWSICVTTRVKNNVLTCQYWFICFISPSKWGFEWGIIKIPLYSSLFARNSSNLDPYMHHCNCKARLLHLPRVGLFEETLSCS